VTEGYPSPVSEAPPPPTEDTRRTLTPARRAEIAWSAAAALTVLLAMGVLLLIDRRYFWTGDTQAAYYGWWYHLGELVRHGEWPPLVDPHAWRAGGLAVEGQWGGWSPLTVSIGLLATAVSRLLVVLALVKAGFAVVAALGTFRLVRSYDAPPAAAYVAAVAVPMGGMTQYLDLPSWAAGEMIWALLPWVWWALRRTMLRGANPLPALVLGYLLVSVGYVFGTIMLIVVLAACLFDCLLRRDRAALGRVLLSGALFGLVALTVYLPGVLSASVTSRDEAFGFGGKFTTDPLTLLASILPTTAVPGTTSHLMPLAYLVWFLPVVLWIDWGRARREWQPIGGLLLFTVASLLIVDGPSRLGPLRWPLRLQPFLVTALVVLLVVAWHRFGVRATLPRLALSLGWVALSGIFAILRGPSMWAGHLCAVALVGGSLALIWWLVVKGRLTWVAPAAGILTLAVFGLQHVFYPTPETPQRNSPTDAAAYQAVLPGAVGDVFQVGASDDLVKRSPLAAHQLLIGSMWYLNDHPVQNTYTAVSYRAYKRRYCVYYQGNTCPRLLDTLFSTEPTTGKPRVDLLGVSSLLLIRRSFPPIRLNHPPAGWQIADRGRFSVLWTRRTPVPGAGGVVWTSPGTQVSGVVSGDNGSSFHVDAVPPSGGTAVLSLLDWPGYATDVGSLAHPVDGYLVTVHLPASAQGETVHVDYRPPGWIAELATWGLALVVGAGWSVLHAVRRRRRRAAVG
jgi:hypothetical protein